MPKIVQVSPKTGKSERRADSRGNNDYALEIGVFMYFPLRETAARPGSQDGLVTAEGVTAQEKAVRAAESGQSWER